MKTETYSRLRDAYQIIDGIPEKNFNLNNWVQIGTISGKPDCGTIACAAGWLTLHPGMQALGFTRNSTGTPSFGKAVHYMAIASFFGLTWDTASDIFGTRGIDSPYDPFYSKHLSDKKLWLARVRVFLAKVGAA